MLGKSPLYKGYRKDTGSSPVLSHDGFFPISLISIYVRAERNPDISRLDKPGSDVSWPS